MISSQHPSEHGSTESSQHASQDSSRHASASQRPVSQDIPASAYFTYQQGTLHAESVSLTKLAAEIGTPCYVYSGNCIDQAYRNIDASLEGTPHLLAYSVKANGNLGLLSRLAAQGCGADIVSGGELARALKAGIPPDKIVFSGVGKTDDELREAVDAGILSINLESESEAEALQAIAQQMGKRARVALRINPDIDPQTHPYIATGLHGTKFGVEPNAARELLPRLLNNPHLSLEGIACHLGSQLLSPEPFRDAMVIVARFAKECAEAGAELRFLDAGGGWPILYGHENRQTAPCDTVGQAIRHGIRLAGAEDLGLRLVVEPGRAIVGDAGVLLTRVTFVKHQGEKRFAIVDAAMTDLIRPALYDAYHAIMPVQEPPPNADQSPADVVGPVCESGDFLARGRPLPELRRGDLLAVRGAGAYASVMASNYNARPRAAEVLVDGESVNVVRKRDSVEDLWRNEQP